MGDLQKLNRLDTIDKVEVSDNEKTATFYFKLILDDKYDPIYNEEANPLKIEVKIANGSGKIQARRRKVNSRKLNILKIDKDF